MNNFSERIITIILGSTLVWFLITYNYLSQQIFLSSLSLVIYGELGHVIYRSNKIDTLDLFILIIVNISFYINVYFYYSSYMLFSYLLMFISKNYNKLFVYFCCGILWIHPSIYLISHYLLIDPYIFIKAATIIWIADGGAYIFGKLFGKHKLAPNLSPNKTIEGFCLGIMCSVIAGFIIYYNNNNSHLDNIMLSFVYGLSGQLGDLIESTFKRWVGVKDSGFLLPGVGGVNDRFDSIYLAIPMGYMYTVLRNIPI